jgi:hypothetical protein
MDNIRIDKIIRSKRKTLALEVARDATLIVRAPEKTPLKYIERLIYKKRFWIREKQKVAKERYQRIIPKEFVNGEGFLYLGNTYRLSIVNEEVFPPLVFDREFRLAKKFLPYTRDMFVKWYKEQAYFKIKERLEWYSTLSGIKYNKFSITDAQKRWGSCSTKGDLRFSWRLIMAPLSVIDYVVIHELTHLVEKNHSKKFWNKIRLIFPNYGESRRWLKNNEHLLIL